MTDVPESVARRLPSSWMFRRGYVARPGHLWKERRASYKVGNKKTNRYYHSRTRDTLLML